MRQIKGNLDKIKKANPNFVEIAAKAVFRVPDVPLVSDPLPKIQITSAQKKRAELIKKRSEIRIGMPRVLNMYSQTPVFTGYFAALGIKAENIVYSDFTSEQLYKEVAKRGAIDPCFPSKLGIPHVHNLLYVVHAKKPLDIIFFPMIDCLTTDLHAVQASRSCPTVAATPEAVKALSPRKAICSPKKACASSIHSSTSPSPKFSSARCTTNSRTSWAYRPRRTSARSIRATRHSTTSIT